HTARYVGGVAVALAQPLDGGCLVAKGRQELEGELGSIKRLLGEFGERLLNFYSIHALSTSGSGRDPQGPRGTSIVPQRFEWAPAAAARPPAAGRRLAQPAGGARPRRLEAR